MRGGGGREFCRRQKTWLSCLADCAGSGQAFRNGFFSYKTGHNNNIQMLKVAQYVKFVVVNFYLSFCISETTQRISVKFVNGHLS